MPSARQHCRLWAAALLLTAAAAAALAAAGDATMEAFGSLTAGGGNIKSGAAVTATATGGLLWRYSAFGGQAGPGASRPVAPDSCVPMGDLGDVIVALAARTLVSETNFVAGMDEAIPAAVSPGGLELKHPVHGTPLTLAMLATHRSSVNDGAFETGRASQPNVAASLADFVTSVFVRSGALVPTVFNNVVPGTSAAFFPARMNTALLAFVLERAIATTPALSTTFPDLKAYIDARVLAANGMTQTFWLSPAGYAPGVEAPSEFTGTYTPPATPVYTRFTAGCLADFTTENAATLAMTAPADGSALASLGGRSPITVHAAWPAAPLMGYTSAADVAQLAAAATRGGALSLSATRYAVAAGTRAAQVAQGLGVIFVDGPAVCQAAARTGVVRVADCPLNGQAGPSSTLVGFSSVAPAGSGRSGSVVGFVCADAATAGAAHGVTCVASAFVGTAAAAGSAPVLAMAGAAMADLFGTSRAPPAVPLPGDPRPGPTDEKYGVWVVVAAWGTFLVVVALTLVIQFFFMPAAQAPAVNVNGLTLAAAAPPGRLGTSPKMD